MTKQREIKFRAWDGNNILPPEDLSQAPKYRKWLAKHDYILMQFTGLLDKNEVEIYEGDIIKCGKYAGTVFWSNACACYLIDNGSDKYERLGSNSTDSSVQFDKTKIIGNRYENPNLLTKSEERDNE